MGFTEKSDFYGGWGVGGGGGFMKNQYRGEDCLKGGGGLDSLQLDIKEGDGVFEGGLIPQYTLCFISLKTSDILENKSQVFERSDRTITVYSDLYYNKLVI